MPSSNAHAVSKSRWAARSLASNGESGLAPPVGEVGAEALSVGVGRTGSRRGDPMLRLIRPRERVRYHLACIAGGGPWSDSARLGAR